MKTVELAYQERGVAGGIPVVLLHGLTDSPATWDDFIAELGRHTFAVTARGHGDSPWPGEYSVDLMAADTLALLDRLGLRQIDLVGHSMGGAVAHRVARERPGLVRRMILEDAPPPPREGPPLPIDLFEKPDEPIDFDWRVVDVMRRDIRAVDPTWWNRLPEMTMRTLAISGGPASHISAEAIAEMAHLMPKAEFATIDVGHCIHTDAFTAFTTLAIPFLGKG
ncbi:alpha/beta fold hydrolase [Acrocarpospora catenulata]|uniref:alpha/beta fold hydrolase n=1 Tax=Acrocarpospora catenulata TaxID=2836182 RepID=UPI001BD9AD04|nr:alpha/beta fold hydrolase [Acrocarpospora catenulata]